MRISDLIGEKVLDSNAKVIGKIIDFEFEFVKPNLIPTSLIVSEGGIQKKLNFNKGELVIPWDIVEYVGDKVILKDAFVENDNVKNDSTIIDDSFVNSNSDESDSDLDLDKFEKEIEDLKSSL